MQNPAVRVLLFFLVAYALTWFGLLGNRIWPSASWPVPMNPLGPILAAPLVIWALDGRAGLTSWTRRILRVSAPARIYAIALFVPLAIILASVGLAVAAGTPHQALPRYSVGEWILGIPLVAIFGPAPEEPAFRGFAQHELQRRLPVLWAALWTGLGVAIWHLPLFVAGEIPPVIAITLFAVSVVYAWLLVNGGSVWPLVLLHWVQNFFGGQLFGRMFEGAASQAWLTILTLFYVAWAGWLVWRCGPALGTGTGSRGTAR